jgi:hypothetical protein
MDGVCTAVSEGITIHAADNGLLITLKSRRTAGASTCSCPLSSEGPQYIDDGYLCIEKS